MSKLITEFNKKQFHEMLRQFMAANPMLTVVNGFISNNRNIIAKDEGEFLTVHEDNSFFNKGIVTAFDLFTELKHGGNEKNAFIHLYHEKQYREKKDKPYIRVGIDYFKKIDHVDRYGIYSVKLKKWSRQELKGDYGNEFKSVVDIYDDFTIEPNNVDYRHSIGNKYNLYAPFPHKPYEGKVNEETHLKWTMILMKHIFGSQWGTKENPGPGIKYMKILYEDPKQPLPILSLVSDNRHTGKSTFIHYLVQLFNANSNIITPEIIKGSFNGSYALKNVIAIEESKFESRQALEKLKSISTQNVMDVNEKFISNYTVPFYGKLIIASNDETKFVQIDDKEIRYWVRKIPDITVDNNNILNDLKEEIPYFLRWLLDIPKFKYETRQALSPKDIETDILINVKKESKTWLYKELYERFIDFFVENSGEKELYFTPLNIKDLWYSKDSKVNLPFIRNVIKTEFELETSDKSIRYTPMTDLDNPFIKKIGRPFTLPITYFEELHDLHEQVNKIESEQADELPF